MKYNPRIVLAWFRECGLPAPEVEYRFNQARKWRFDFAWPKHGLALEVQGGIWTYGGHNRGAGLVKEHEKRNTAALLGWRILYCEPKDLCTCKMAEIIRRAL